MQITIRKPSRSGFKFPQKGSEKGYLKQFEFFYNYNSFSTRNFPISLKRLAIMIFVISILTFVMYFISSYLRATDLSNTEIIKQVGLINYTLWLAYLLFVVGLNGFIIVFMRLYKTSLNIKVFLFNQVYVAVILFFLMRLVATVLILADEILPFEINYNFRFFNFSLLTVLFLTQILLAITTYNYLKLNLGEKISKHPILEVIISVIYTASIWTLTTP